MTDREIIDMLAKEFMGWDTKAWRDETDGGYQWVDVRGKYVAKYSPYEDDPRWTWNPLVDPAACMLILDELELQEFKWEWEYYPWMKEPDYSFRCWNGDESRGGHGDAGTRYRAVCLAALAAIGE